MMCGRSIFCRSRALVIGWLIQVEIGERKARRKVAEQAAKTEEIKVKELARKQHKK